MVNIMKVNIVKKNIRKAGKRKKHCLYTVKKRDEIYINHLKYYTNHLNLYS